MMENKALRRFRVVSLVEGISTIVLFLVAMPMKYLLDIPLAVKIAGPLHGALFLRYVGMLVSTWASQGWRLRMFIVGLLAAIPPFGTLLFDHYMVKPRVVSTDS